MNAPLVFEIIIVELIASTIGVLSVKKAAKPISKKTMLIII